MSPLKKAHKNLTVNNLPTEMVDTLKFLAIEYDCTITVLMLAILQRAFDEKDRIYADVHAVKMQQKKEKTAMKKVKAELEALKGKMDHVGVS